MGPLAAVRERQEWADRPASDGLFATPGRLTQPFGSRRRDPGASEMRPRVTVEIRINVALCLFGIAAIIKTLM